MFFFTSDWSQLKFEKSNHTIQIMQCRKTISFYVFSITSSKANRFIVSRKVYQNLGGSAQKKELRNMIRWLDESQNVIHILTTRRPSFWVVILGFPRLKWISCANFCPFLSKIILCNAYIQKEQRGYKKEKKNYTHTHSFHALKFEVSLWNIKCGARSDGDEQRNYETVSSLYKVKVFWG